jgi:excisionase family DNA binding protein
MTKTLEPASSARSDYTVPGVAKIFKCSSGTVLNWIRNGRLKAYRLGGTGHFRVPWAEVERLRADWTYSPQTREA